jgi:hypothetical protein
MKNTDLMVAKLIKFFYCIFIFSIFMTFFINPGIPGRKYFLKSIKLEEGKTYFICKECNLMAPDELNIAHCKKCSVCILNHDHHCSWVGKCIGKGNIVFFSCFLISLFLFIFTSLFIIFIIFVKIYKN